MKSNLLFFLFLLIAGKSFSQIRYGISTSFVQSNLIEIKLDKQGSNSNKYYPISGWEFGGFARIELKQIPFSIEQEIVLKQLGTHVKAAYMDGGALEYDYPFKTISLPLNIHYRYTNWLSAYCGIVYSHSIKNEDLRDYKYTDFYRHTMGYNLGIDVKVKNKIRIGAFYFKSLNRNMDMNFMQIGFKSTNYGLKVGYILN